MGGCGGFGLVGGFEIVCDGAVPYFGMLSVKRFLPSRVCFVMGWSLPAESWEAGEFESVVRKCGSLFDAVQYYWAVSIEVSFHLLDWCLLEIIV